MLRAVWDPTKVWKPFLGRVEGKVIAHAVVEKGSALHARPVNAMPDQGISEILA